VVFVEVCWSDEPHSFEPPAVSMALRWTSAAMLEAAKGFRRLKAYGQLSTLRTALAAHHAKHTAHSAVEPPAKAA
jgi:putative transposase